jgi:hypothetical protein
VFALFGEYIVGLAQFVRRHRAYCGLGRDPFSCGLRRRYQDQVHLPHSRQKRSEGGRGVVPGGTYSRLYRADLTGAKFTGTVLDGADLTYAIFEPDSLPEARSFAAAEGLELLTYRENPGALVQLRKEMQDLGFRDQERKITYAINRRQAQFAVLPERLFKKVAFDLTCDYGMSPGRPLRIVLYMWLVCAALYYLFIQFSTYSGLLVISPFSGQSRPRRRIQKVGHISSLYPRTNGGESQAEPTRRRAWVLPLFRSRRWLRAQWRMAAAAVFFSLMSAFNIGFRDINFGRWMRLLTKREYDLKAFGWARTVSGVQSLVSVFMIALWVFTYFGRPFQ